MIYNISQNSLLDITMHVKCSYRLVIITLSSNMMTDLFIYLTDHIHTVKILLMPVLLPLNAQ